MVCTQARGVYPIGTSGRGFLLLLDLLLLLVSLSLLLLILGYFVRLGDLGRRGHHISARILIPGRSGDDFACLCRARRRRSEAGGGALGRRSEGGCIFEFADGAGDVVGGGFVFLFAVYHAALYV